MDFLDELDRRIIPGDGPAGPQLTALGVPPDACFEALNADAPERVRELHKCWLAAGSRIIRTNSFAGNAIRLASSGNGHRVGELNWLAAQIAGTVAKSAGAAIAASVGPLGLSPEESARTDRRSLFQDQLGALLDGGARLVLLEAFTVLEELLAALEAKHTLHHCPVIATIVCDSAGVMPDGTSLREAIAILRAAEADVIGIHVSGDPATALSAIRTADANAILAAFPGAGFPPCPPTAFAEGAMALATAGVRFIGGGDGVGPAQIAAFTARLEEVPPPL